MTLEEIERESAKLSDAERAMLASRLQEGCDLPVAGSNQRSCPRCKKPTKRIDIEVEAADWGRNYFLGIFAVLYPDKERARVCEHCGHVFDRVLVTNPVGDRIVKFMLIAIAGSVIIGVIWMFVRATMV